MYENSTYEKKVSFHSFLNTFFSKWYIFVSIILISVLISVFYAFNYVTPLYSSTAKLYIINKDSYQISSADMSVSTSIAKDFETIIKDPIVTEEVAKMLENRYSVSQIKESIKLTNPDDTRIIEIKATTADLKTSKKITESYCEILPQKAIDLMGVDRVTVINKGALSEEPASSRRIRVIIYSTLLGFAVSVLLIICTSMLSNKIITEKDVEDVLGLNVLATIPYNKNRKANQKKVKNNE